MPLKQLTHRQITDLREYFREAMADLDEETGGANEQDLLTELESKRLAASTTQDFAELAGEMAWDLESTLTLLNKAIHVWPMAPGEQLDTAEQFIVFGLLCRDYGLDPRIAEEMAL